MLRAVLAVLVVLAILAVSQPAIQQGRQDHAATLLAEEVEGFVDESEDLVRTDEAVDGPGARRIVTIELPASQRFSAGASYVEIIGDTPSSIEWAVHGGATQRTLLEDLALQTPDGDPLRLERAGDHRLLLTLTGSPGDPVVEVSRFEPPGGEEDA